MLDRAAVDPGAEVVERLRRKAPVDDVERGGAHVAGHRVAAPWREQKRRDYGHENQHHGNERQQPLHAPGVKGRERQPPRPLELVDQERRDQKARNDEEDVHANEAARGECETRVTEQHGADRNRPQPLDVRAELHSQGRDEPSVPAQRSSRSSRRWSAATRPASALARLSV